MSQTTKAYLLLVTTMALWGGNAVAARLAVGHISPMGLTTGRWLLVLIAILAIMRRPLLEAWPVLRARWRFVLLMGALGFTSFNVLMYVAAQYTPAVNLTLLQGSIPVFTVLGAYPLYGTRIRPLQAAGLVLTLIGLALVASHGDLSSLAALDLNFGDVLMLIACLCYALYTLLLKQRPQISSLGFFCGVTLAAITVSVPMLAGEIALGLGRWPDARGLAVLGYVAIGPTLIAQLFYMRAVDAIGPARAGLFVNLVPVIGALLAVGLLGEAFGMHHVIALGLVLGGIGLAESAVRLTKS